MKTLIVKSDSIEYKVDMKTVTSSHPILVVPGDTIKCTDCNKVDCMCYEDAIER